MRRALQVVVVVATVAFSAACGGGDDDVDWSNYAPGVQRRIERLGDAGDCAGLQEQFDIADGNDEAQRERTGTGNADLMRYIDAKLEDAGCY